MERNAAFKLVVDAVARFETDRKNHLPRSVGMTSPPLDWLQPTLQQVLVAIEALGVIKFDPPTTNAKNPAFPKAMPTPKMTADDIVDLVNRLPSWCFRGELSVEQAAARHYLAQEIIRGTGAAEVEAPDPGDLIAIPMIKPRIGQPDLLMRRSDVIGALERQGYVIAPHAGLAMKILALINSDVVYLREPKALAEDIVELLIEARAAAPADPVARPPRRHVLKSWPRSFAMIQAGTKPFDVRLNDRDFRPYDTVLFREYEVGDRYTGVQCSREITSVMRLDDPDLMPPVCPKRDDLVPYVVLGLKVIAK